MRLEALLRPLGSRAFGFLLLLLALPNFIPVPFGIGGVMGVLVLLTGMQMAIGMPQPWLPRRLRLRRLPRERVERFVHRCMPLMRRIEKVCHPRMFVLTRRPASAITGVVMMVLGFLLALPLPFTNYVFGVVLVAFAIVLIERDGALLLGIWALSAALTVGAVIYSDNVWALIQRLWSGNL